MPRQPIFPTPVRALFVGAVLVCAGLSALPAAACPFCPPQLPTLSERVARSDVAVLGQWVSAHRKGDDDVPGSTTYRIVRLLRGGESAPQPGRRVTLPRYRGGQSGDLFFLTGREDEGVLNWDDALEISETGFNYVAQAPSIETPAKQRLPFFAKFLEFPDPLIANDAFAEFSQAAYEDVAPLARTLPREKVRRWLTSPDTPPVRLGLYGMMLGLCGNDDDARLLEQIITEPAADFRLGIDGMIGGYLLLTGERGLELIENTKLRDETASTSETYAALQALRFLWTYVEDGPLEKERLQASLRTLLDRPALAELAITDLARWQDWSIQDRLMARYDDEDYDDPRLKTAVIRYLLASTKDKHADDAPPPHVVRGRRYLDQLRERDPALFERAIREVGTRK